MGHAAHEGHKWLFVELAVFFIPHGQICEQDGRLFRLPGVVQHHDVEVIDDDADGETFEALIRTLSADSDRFRVQLSDGVELVPGEVLVGDVSDLGLDVAKFAMQNVILLQLSLRQSIPDRFRLLNQLFCWLQTLVRVSKTTKTFSYVFDLY